MSDITVIVREGAPGPAGMVWRGSWDVGTAYVFRDVVEHDGSVYFAPSSTTGDEPPAGPWELMAAKGDQGDEGPQGPVGISWEGEWNVATAYDQGDAVEHDGSSWFATEATDPGDEPGVSGKWDLIAAKGEDGEGSPATNLSPSVDAAEQAGAVGTSVNYARRDHEHPSEAFVPSTGVITGLDEKAEPHDDDVLVIEDSEDGNAPKKVKKSTLGNGASGAWELIAKEVLDEATSAIEFEDIDQSYAHLVLVANLRSDRAGSDTDSAVLRLNGDSGDNYDSLQFQVRSSTSVAESYETNGIAFPTVAAVNAPANSSGDFVAWFYDYSSTNWLKSTRVENIIRHGTSANNLRRQLISGWRRNTEAITKIVITPSTGPNFVAGSAVRLYGVRGPA